MTDPTSGPAATTLEALRGLLNDARDTDDAERTHAALVDVVDGLITHAQQQEHVIATLRSEMGFP